MDNFEIIKAILFVSGKGLELKKIAEILSLDEDETEIILNNLMHVLNTKNKGLHIIKSDNTYQMCTNPNYLSYVEKLVKTKKEFKLSESILEVLAIILFNQPITKSRVNEIRGVNSEYNINKLIEYNLVEEKGRSNAIGKPILFGTTTEFLKYYGVSSIDEIIESNINIIQEKVENTLRKTDF